jgi:hypothetical protein
MARFVESFDSYSGLGVGVGIRSRWFDAASGDTSRQQLTAGRFGTGQAFNHGTGSGATVHQLECLLADESGSYFTGESFSLHVAMAVSTGLLTTSGNEKGIVLTNSSGLGQIGLQWDAGRWSVVRWGAGVGGPPAAVLATTPLEYTDTDWRSFQLRGQIDSSAGWFELRIDDVLVLSGTGVNTGTGTIDRVSLFAGNNGNNVALYGLIYDDIVIEDDNSAFLPPLRIDGLPPVSDGGTLNLVPSTGTSHYAVVDESAVTTADYLSGSAVGELDLLGVANMTVAPSRILGLNLVGYAAKTDVTARAWNLGLKSGGTTSNGPDLGLTTSVGYFHRMLETDPATAAEWLKSGVDAVELQPRIAV